jgi:serine/threonine protein kinase
MRYELSNLQKNSLSVNNSQKITISCQDKLVGNTKDWLEVVKSLKIEREFDKSRILLGILDKNDKVVVKIGDDSNITHEYKIGKALKHRKEFIKFVCFFECDDKFTSYPGVRSYSSTEGGTYAPSGGYLCNGPGSSMKIIVMPHFEVGSLGDYSWNKTNIHSLRCCLQQTVLIVWINFSRYGFIHGDLHAKNILLSSTDSTSLTYKIKDKEIIIAKHGYDVVMMDFENSKIVDLSLGLNLQDLNEFYFDLTKLFSLLPTFIKGVDLSKLQIINGRISSLSMSMKFEEGDVADILPLIDDIQFI